jgi:hypothetical protein
MATQTLVFRSTHLYSSHAREALAQVIKQVKPLLPRPCMLASVGLILAGLCIPFLMGLELIPISLFLGLIGMVSTCMGIVLTLYYL